jgi:hypothetical protein
MDLHYRSWRPPIKYFLTLAWVNCDPLSTYDMSKKSNFLQSESTLVEFGIELMVLKSLQNNAEMPHVIFFALGIDQDVINEDNDKLVQLWHEYRVHQVHEICRSIGEPKRHNQILIQPVPGGESGLRNVFRVDFDLVITRTKIDLGKDFCTDKLIEKNVDVRQWIFVLDNDDVERSVVNS